MDLLRYLLIAIACLVVSACGGGNGQDGTGSVKGVVLQAFAPSSVAESGNTLTAAALFDWAPGRYPHYFPGPSLRGEAFVDGYGTFTYAHWPESGNYLGVLDGAVYIKGPYSGGQITRLGALEDFRCPVLGCGLPVLRSSYENKVRAGEVLGPQWVGRQDLSAFADFFQEGSYSRVINTLEYYPSWEPTKLGKIQFFRQINGQWVDRTSDLLDDPTGCLHPRKAVVADFNGDGKPDVFLACHGFDRPPWPGENARVLLSQPNGRYSNVLLPITCYCHSASAVDYGRKGFADILITGYGPAREPVFLANRGDGTFAVDTSRLPALQYPDAVSSVELIDLTQTGRYDVWLGSDEADPYHPMARSILLSQQQTNWFKDSPVRALPVNVEYSMPLDLVVKKGKMFVLRTNGGNSGVYGISAYTKSALQVIDLQSLESTLSYTHQGPYSGSPSNLWINWIISHDSHIKAADAGYDISVPE